MVRAKNSKNVTAAGFSVSGFALRRLCRLPADFVRFSALRPVGLDADFGIAARLYAETTLRRQFVCLRLCPTAAFRTRTCRFSRPRARCDSASLRDYMPKPPSASVWFASGLPGSTAGVSSSSSRRSKMFVHASPYLNRSSVPGAIQGSPYVRFPAWRFVTHLLPKGIEDVRAHGFAILCTNLFPVSGAKVFIFGFSIFLINIRQGQSLVLPTTKNIKLFSLFLD